MKKFFTVKAILVVAFVGCRVVSAQAQQTLPEAADTYEQGFRLGVGVSAGYPFERPYDFTLGGDVRLQYDLSKRTSLTLTTGFSNLFVSGNDNDLGFIPVKAGFKGFIYDDQFYLIGEVGAAFAVTNDYDKTSLVLAPGVGYATKNLDFSLRYEYYSKFVDDKGSEGVGQVAFRIAYGFKI